MKTKWAVNGFGNSGFISCLAYSHEQNTLTKTNRGVVTGFLNMQQRQNLADCFHWNDDHFYIYYTIPKIVRSTYEESV